MMSESGALTDIRGNPIRELAIRTTSRRSFENHHAVGQATCRRVALIADRWTWIATPREIKQKSLEGIFSSRPAAARGRVAAGATISALQRSAAGDAGVSARSGPKVCAL
jgi:hypothetical protein